MLKPVFVCSLVQARIISTRDVWNLSLSERGDIHYFIDVLHIVL